MVERGSYVPWGENQDRVNDYLFTQIETIIKKILNIIRPFSIILYGSLGRGEGTYRYVQSNLSLISDIEIGIVSKDITKISKIRALNEEINADMAKDVTLSFFLPRRFTTKVSSNWALPSRYPTLEQYELINGLQVLYGNDPRLNGIIILPTDIMPWDALRLIFNRIAELLGSISELPIRHEHLVKQTNKLLIACGDAVLLLTGNYHFSYQNRRQKLNNLISMEPPSNRPQEVMWENVLDAYNWKLNVASGNKATNLSIEAIFHQIVIPIMRFSTQRLLGWSFQDVDEFRKKYLESPQLKYLSRSFSDCPFLQTILINIKQSKSFHMSGKRISTWRNVHEVYAELILTSDSLSMKDVPISTLLLTKDERTQINSLEKKWRQLCSL